MMGSEGFVAIGVLSGHQHSHRHDLESLFYVLPWLAIGSNRDADDACGMLEGIPESSRLRKWYGIDFGAFRREKAADMSAEGFPAILDEFSPDPPSLFSERWPSTCTGRSSRCGMARLLQGLIQSRLLLSGSMMAWPLQSFTKAHSRFRCGGRK